jgi:nucleotide sugar dehydrogenase
MSNLKRLLLSGERKIAIWGTGYVGFSTMASFAAQGVMCVGTDISESVVSTINEGRMPVPNMEYWLGFDPSYLVRAGTMSATADWRKLLAPEFAVHMLAIPTEKEDKPWDGALEDVVKKIAENFPGSENPPLVVTESTLTPKKTDEVVIPIFEHNGIAVGKDVLVGVAPRRDWFISPEKSLKTLPRIVGGTTQDTTRQMLDVLSIVCDKLLPAQDHRHAEIVKSIENAYRHVEITLANQLSLAFPSLNMTEVLKLVGTKWNIGTYHPSFGTGGYCIPLASQYVLAGAERPEYLTILKDAVATDEKLPTIVADRVAEEGFKRVGILGLSYKGDLKVHVLSPTIRITKRLAQRAVAVKINDPYYADAEITRLTGAQAFAFPQGLSEFDCVIIVAGHRLYRAIPEERLRKYLTSCRMIIDNVEEAWRGYDWRSAGIEYFAAGDSGWIRGKEPSLATVHD